MSTWANASARSDICCGSPMLSGSSEPRDPNRMCRACVGCVEAPAVPAVEPMAASESSDSSDSSRACPREGPDVMKVEVM